MIRLGISHKTLQFLDQIKLNADWIFHDFVNKTLLLIIIKINFSKMEANQAMGN
jgi:hypothetical protein